MIKSLTILLLVIINFLLIPKKVFSSLKINEVYPYPDPFLNGKEWVELFNSSDDTIDLSYYLLVDATDKNIVFSTSSALPLSYILATSSGVINNTGPETIFLKNVNNDVLDIASYSSSITFNAGKSLIRCPDGEGEWYLSSFITKNQSNQEACTNLTPTLIPTITQIFSPTPSPIFVLTQTPTPTPISFEKIYLSEVMVDPANGEKEWVEIYNDNDFLVKLDNWFIDDFENRGSTPKSFNMVLDKKSYGVIELSSAIFNNSGDQVRLLDFNKLEKDGFEYSSSKSGKTHGRISFSSEEWCLQEPTKGKENSSCLTMVTKTSDSLTPSLNSQLSKSSSSPSKKNANFFSSFKQENRYPNKKIFKSYQLKLVHPETEKTSLIGEVLAEKTKRNNKKNDLLFLPLFYSLSSNFFFLRKILKQIPASAT